MKTNIVRMIKTTWESRYQEEDITDKNEYIDQKPNSQPSSYVEMPYRSNVLLCIDIPFKQEH